MAFKMSCSVMRQLEQSVLRQRDILLGRDDDNTTNVRMGDQTSKHTNNLVEVVGNDFGDALSVSTGDDAVDIGVVLNEKLAFTAAFANDSV